MYRRLQNNNFNVRKTEFAFVIVYCRAVSHGEITRESTKSFIASLPQAATGESSASARSDKFTIFQSRRDGQHTLELQSSDEAQEEGEPLRRGRWGFAVGNVRWRGERGLRAGSIHLLRKATSSLGRVAGETEERYQAEFIPQRDRGESAVPEVC